MSDNLNTLYRAINKRREEHLNRNPICQKCETRRSVSISKWGDVLACCNACLEAEYRAVHDDRVIIDEESL